MPLPLLIGAAVLATGWGAKKGLDAKKDFAKASEYNSDAKRIYEHARKTLDISRVTTNQSLEDLGRTKVSIYNKSLKQFIEIFERIKNIDISELKIDNLSTEIIKEMIEMKSISISMEEIAGAGIASISAGALAGLGAYGGAMTFAAASTGTAIGSLSGVAATNATLAWFGGGSLAAGGMGMAGGAAVLGGVVAGPVLMVAGMMAASKAEKARADAYSNLKEAQAASEIMTAAKKTSDIIGFIAIEINDILIELDSYFKSMIVKLSMVVIKSSDYSSYNESEKSIVVNTVAYAITLKNIMDFSVMDENGNPLDTILNKSKELEKEAINLYEKISLI